ncbi:flagellar biosynthetic protein FliO [Jatrophihabitans telluris]|uniref:Flagellar biosynthetic protein FliO n=1 Tax=Jatrophihabitans telluris TaxID=2038343 RepID=A0ABY4QWQ8_9ACTN|nr:flagellar biosynthetic protein FliO [Jatrophihabitans telluris]UQX87965.1 flagellar biosynthetic protein FliO [Jatrophihabitans telluris]
MNAVELIGRMLLALGVVLAIMWALARFARRPLTGKNDRVLAVLARQQINRNASVAVLKVADRALVIGVSEHGVRLLAETELDPIQQALDIDRAPAPRRGAKGLRAESDAVEVLPRVSRRTVTARTSATAPAAATGPAGSVAQTGAQTAGDNLDAELHALLATSSVHAATAAPHATRASRHRKSGRGSLDGSILSPKTWSQLVVVARNSTVRK